MSSIKMTNQLLNILEDFGLKPDDARVYLFLLQNPRPKVTSIGASLNINRTTVYLILERLKSNKLIIEVFDGWKKYYQAEKPTVLPTLLEQRKQKLESSLHLFESIEPKIDNSPKFFSSESIPQIYDNLLENIKKNDYYYVFTDQSFWLNSQYQDFFLDFIQRRNDMPIQIKMIFTVSEIAHIHAQIQTQKNVQIKLTKNRNQVLSNFILTPQFFIIHKLVPNDLAIVFQDEVIINSYKEIFETFWEAV